MITISRERLQRVLQALSFASVEETPRCLEMLRTTEEDEFAEIEISLAIFVEELSQVSRGLADALQVQEGVNRELQAQIETIERQRLAIRELSTPIIEVWSQVLCLPVVGIVDSQRSAEMTERLLQSIVDKQARLAIVDITGIEVLDTRTADHFIKMAKAVRLLGAECVLTGMNPGIAQTLTHIGVDLANVRTLRNLRDALHQHLQERWEREAREATARGPRGL